VSRTRNFSNWAYWRLHLEAAAEDDPCPTERLAAEFDAWRERARERLARLLGPMPAPVPLAVEVVGSTDCDCYRRDEIVFDSERTMSVPAYLLVPHGRRAPGPAVLALHGHGAGKTMVCDIDGGEPQRRAEIDEYNGAYAHALAAAGFVVLAPDLRGFGARADRTPDDKYHCDWDLVCATMAGVVPLGRNLWDAQRAVDVLSEHPLVDSRRIGVAGLSYGGTVSLFLAAVDRRIRAAVVSGYLSSWRAAHTVPFNMCGSQVLPGQLGALEHLDLGALAAPVPLCVETGADDLIFPLAAARASVAGLARVYEHLGARDAIVHDVFDGGHRWHGAVSVPFLRDRLGLGA
jgi:dienelactone hydrolase